MEGPEPEKGGRWGGSLDETIGKYREAMAEKVGWDIKRFGTGCMAMRASLDRNYVLDAASLDPSSL